MFTSIEGKNSPETFQTNINFHMFAQASQAHVWRKGRINDLFIGVYRKRRINYLFIHIGVTACEVERDLSSYAVLGYTRTVENLSVLWAVV